MSYHACQVVMHASCLGSLEHFAVTHGTRGTC
jgi:hypothetical protein